MIKIREYRDQDWVHIVAAHDPARMQELCRAGLEAAYLPLSIAAQREGLFDYSVAVAELDGEVIGFTAFTADELAWLYVRPDLQRRGVGRALAQYAMTQMQPGEKTVEVLCGNEPARRLYRSLGFVKETKVSGVMPGNEAFAVSVWQMQTQEDAQ